MQILQWQALSSAAQSAALSRPAQRDAQGVRARVREIIATVRARGDAALRDYTAQFDQVRTQTLEVQPEELREAHSMLGPQQHAAIQTAIGTVRAFHEAQRSTPLRLETVPGVVCERIVRPVRAVGLYVPAGSAPLPSTAIMLAVPAAIAGCEQRILCTPPGRTGRADAAVLVAARKAGITRIFKCGGAQAIAAMAYGTASIPKCDKIFGPGNAWVTEAKLQVASDPGGAAFDLPAGVSEVMIIADETANPEFIAADLLAQAEHSTDAQALLVSDSIQLVHAVGAQVAAQISTLSRREILAASVANMRLIAVPDLLVAMQIVNQYAPEHLILEVRQPRGWLVHVNNAGAVFLGSWSPESVGDYCSGPNHTLPTYGYARSYSGLSVEDFQKRLTVQELSEQGLRNLGPTTEILARLEGLDAHAAAVTRRLRHLASAAP